MGHQNQIGEDSFQAQDNYDFLASKSQSSPEVNGNLEEDQEDYDDIEFLAQLQASGMS